MLDVVGAYPDLVVVPHAAELLVAVQEQVGQVRGSGAWAAEGDERTQSRGVPRGLPQDLALSARGILAGTVETAQLPALMPLRSAEEAQRVWQISEQLTKTAFVTN